MSAASRPLPEQLPGILQQQGDPLAELRDIHPPGPIDDWPPAPGWWLLAILALLALVAASTVLYQRWRNNRYRRQALEELKSLISDWHSHQDDRRYLAEVQTLLKRTALTGFPREAVASLTGEAWVAFLDRSTGTRNFSIGDAEALVDGNYNPDLTIPVEAVHKIAEEWIRKHHPGHVAACAKKAAG